MNLQEEMGNKIIIRNVNTKDFMPVVTFEDAIKIAGKYATEMCRRQRMLCLSEVNKEYNINFAKTILNAPLATENKNDN